MELKSRTRWRAKLEKDQPAKVVAIPPKWIKRFGQGTMVIPRPLDVDALIRGVRKGRLVTQSQLRARLARDYKADHACPLCTGIFLRIAAEAAEEGLRSGKRRITPWWRVVRDDGSLIEKLPGGARAQAARLRGEGFSVPAGGRRPHVKDFRNFLAAL
jgi:hypothetical protein